MHSMYILYIYVYLEPSIKSVHLARVKRKNEFLELSKLIQRHYPMVFCSLSGNIYQNTYYIYSMCTLIDCVLFYTFASYYIKFIML